MGKRTDAVHAGEQQDAHGSVNTAIVASSTYLYPDMPDGSESAYIYCRYANPTTDMVEQRYAALEGAKHSLCFASGMAAIHAVCQTQLQPGNTMAVQQGVYGGTTAYLEQELAPWGVGVETFALGDPLPQADLVWLESITNPLLRVANVPDLTGQAHAMGAKVCVDATFASPLLQRPLEMGADFVVHSATKYLGGHSDLTAGVLGCNTELTRLWTTRRNTGATLDPTAAYLLGRGMKTLPLRMARQGENALLLAQRLEEAGFTVHHPGLESHPDHDVANRVLQGPCAMLTVDAGSLEAAKAFRQRVKIVRPAASLGGVESLVSLPIETSHAYATADQRAELGITDGLLRISVGAEDVQDLQNDVLGALS